MFKNGKASAWEKEWATLLKKEQVHLLKCSQKKESALNQMLEEKIPEKLQSTLEHAFEKAFTLIFEKGIPVIEKTYQKEEMEKRHKINQYSAQLYGDRKRLKVFEKNVRNSGTKNLLISSVEGVGLGILGIGIPDIPIFTGVMLKSIYETALHYGYSYETEAEKYFILEMIYGAFSKGESLTKADEAINEFIDRQKMPEGVSLENQIQKVTAILSKELLYMKFLQGIPVVGAVGGAYDSIYLQMVQKYVRLKYYRRFLSDCREKYK